MLLVTINGGYWGSFGAHLGRGKAAWRRGMMVGDRFVGQLGVAGPRQGLGYVQASQLAVMTTQPDALQQADMPEDWPVSQTAMLLQATSNT